MIGPVEVTFFIEDIVYFMGEIVTFLLICYKVKFKFQLGGAEPYVRPDIFKQRKLTQNTMF